MAGYKEAHAWADSKRSPCYSAMTEAYRYEAHYTGYLTGYRSRNTEVERLKLDLVTTKVALIVLAVVLITIVGLVTFY